MNITKDKERTAPCGMEYLSEEANKTYQVCYLNPNESERSVEFDSFDKACDAALEFASKIAAQNKIDLGVRTRVMKSISVFDTLEEREVTPTDVYNQILDMVKNMK